MTYKTKSCPHCGQIYAWMETTHHRYGSPFRTCQQCKKTFIDNSYKELACLDYRRIKEKKVDPFSIFSSLMGLLFLVFALLQATDPDNGGMHILFLLVGVFMLFGGGFSISKDLSSYQSRCKQLEQEIARSKRRLSNPAYARSLADLGVDVPKEYLRTHPAKPKQEPIYYMDASNGMTVRVPESKLEAWLVEQDRIKNVPAAAELTEAEKKLRDAILHDLYGKRHSSYKGSEDHD